MTENKQITKKYPGPEATGKFIKELRKAHNLTQDDLGSKVFVTRKAVSKWENGICYPSIDTIPFLADALDVTFDEILTAEFSDDNPLNDKNKYGYILRVLRSKQIKNLIKITILFIMITLLIFYHENHNSTKIYKLFYEDDYVYLKNGIIITTRSKTYLNLGTITTDFVNADIASDSTFRLYYKDNNNQEKTLLEYNADTIIHNEKNYYKELNNVDIRNKLNNLYLKMIYKDFNNQTKEYEMHLNVELYFQNDDILDYQKSDKENPFNTENYLISETENKTTEKDIKYIIDIDFLYKNPLENILKKILDNKIDAYIQNDTLIINDKRALIKFYNKSKNLYIKNVKNGIEIKKTIENNKLYFGNAENELYNVINDIVLKIKN